MNLPKFLAISVPGVAVGYILSWKLHPFLYRKEASQFARLRGGPGIGYVAMFLNTLVKLEVIDNEINGHERTVMHNALALLWGFSEIAGGVFLADMCRSVGKYRDIL